jgi:hypothetical protein
LACRFPADPRTQKIGSSCVKYQNRHRQLKLGLFVVFCLDCQRCLGFSMMRHAKSPRTVMEFINTRFPVAPQLIVYDNACNAAQFALNRVPEFVKHTEWRVDAVHWPNHTTCAASYNIKAYTALAGMNSQRAEQNVRLSALSWHTRVWGLQQCCTSFR